MGGGSNLYFWTGVSNLTHEPIAPTTPRSAAILLPWLFCNSVQQKPAKKAMHYLIRATQLVLTALNNTPITAS